MYSIDVYAQSFDIDRHDYKFIPINGKKEYEEYILKEAEKNRYDIKNINKESEDYFTSLDDLQTQIGINFVISLVSAECVEDGYEFTNYKGKIKKTTNLPDFMDEYNGDNGHYDYSCPIEKIDECLRYLKQK